MATIRGILIVPVLLLLCLFHVQSSSYFQKLTCKQIERCDESLTNSTFRFLNSPNPFELFRESKLKTKNKVKNGSCDSSLDGSSCRDKRSIKSSQIYSDTVTDDKSNVQCGGVLNSANGIVTSPNYPNPFNVSGECLWKIKTSDGSHLFVNLIDLELDASLDCTQNVLIIYDGPTDQDSQLLVACNQKQLDNNLVTSRGNELTIKLITNGSTNKIKGFKFSYETDCNNFIEGISGSIESPINQSSKSLNCSWTIKVPKGNNISLVIEKFKSSDSSSCSTSYLSFISNQTTKTFCQSVDYTDFDPILITENQVQVIFVNLYPDNQSYFRLEWKLVGCGGDIHESEGELVSPNYPDSYPNGLNCLWTIHGKPSDIIKIFINEYHIEEGDSLQIFDGPSTRSHRLVNFSGRLKKRLRLKTTRNHATISFNVDNYYGGKGFKFLFRSENDDEHPFDGSFHLVTGSIASPGYPNRYENPITHEWILNDDMGYTEVTIKDLDIPWSEDCTDHYLSFTARGDELTRLCGNEFPTTPIKSNSSKSIVIYYFSSYRHNGRGFMVTYQTTCDSTRTIYNQQYELSNFNNLPIGGGQASCQYHLNSYKKFNQTLLTFVDFAIKQNSDSYIDLLDGESNEPTAITRYNSSSHLPTAQIFGKSFHFHIKGQVLFTVLYSQYFDSCKYELNSWEGTFNSPGYPNDYPPSQTCVWKINLAQGNLISLKFHSFDVQYDQFCALDHLEIREENESGKLIGRFCGSNLPQLNSTQYYPSLWIRFKSHANGSASGFKASYKTIKDVKINSDSGKIGSFAYPRIFSSENNQSWTIKTSNSNKIKFKLESIDILDDSFDSSCSNSSITIYDGPSVNSSILGQFCGYRAGYLPIYTTSSIAYVHFKPNFYISRFLLSWTSVSKNIPFPLIDDPNHLCKYTANLKLNQNLTLLSSSYPNDLSCSWTISNPMGTQLQVEINEMDIKLHSDEKCHKNRVSFYDYSFDHEKDWKINRIVCDSKEKLFTLQGNQSLISFFNYGGLSTELKGFNITVRPICGGTFYGPTGQRVEIKFKSFNLGSSDNHCSNGYLSIHNGDSPDSRLLGHYCGGNLPTKIVSESNKLFISTYVPVSEQFEFSLSYRQVSAPCEFTVELNESTPSAIIQLPGYPYPPDEYSECDWVIKAPINRVIRIDFEIPDHDIKCDLNSTHVDIYEGSTQLSPKIGQFCPIARTTSVVTSDNHMFIHFLSKGGAGSSSFKATVNLHVCGGIFVIREKTAVKSPSYPEPYDVNLTCNYKIYPGQISKMLTFQFLTLDLPSNENCSSGDYLEFHKYVLSRWFVAKECGTKNLKGKAHSSINKLFMRFKSDSTLTGKGFKIWFDYENDNIYNDYIYGNKPGMIESPRFPKIYPVGRNCTYKFTGPMHKRVTLNFTRYNLKSGENCVGKIRIEFYQDILQTPNSQNLRKISTKNITIPCELNSNNYVIQSPSNRLTVYFETYSGLEAGQGFRAEYHFDQPTECGGSIDPISRSIISTNFSQPVVGSSRISCYWNIITRDPEKNISTKDRDHFGRVYGPYTPWISFDQIEVLGSAENDSICSDGRITLSFQESWDGSESYHSIFSSHNRILCGQSSKRITVISPVSIIFFYHITANFTRTLGYRGFKAHYHTSQCGGTIKSSNGTITTPGWPHENYPIDTVCVWTILNTDRRKTDRQIQIEFNEFDLESDCSKDYLEIYEINNFEVTSIGKYCSKKKPQFVQTYQDGISIVFKSDGDETSKGFSLNYRVTQSSCGEYQNSRANRYHEFQGPYKTNQDCESLLEVEPPYRLNLTFVKRFEIEDSVNCSKDYLDINEWRNNSWHHFGRYCGYNSPGSIIFKENKAKLMFHSDGDDRRGDGFDYYVTKYCRLTIDKRGNGTIKSPDYLALYSIGYCEWTFKGEDPDDKIFVQFNDFDISGRSCEEVYMEVIKDNRVTGENRIERYCRDNPPKSIEAHGNLRIISNAFKDSYSRGFTFDYQIVN
ncbi:cubilin-like isoform X2 [Panonychus citri]|uniref:cubilin-like isoform X2 n=1 Tax=Panonychus citri TaxID=50023 RepID=UPI00230729D5|nr:cubilin-like isoform X2 [Panonychus citri]